MDQPAKAFIAVGNFIGVVALVRLLVVLRSSFSMHPQETSTLFTALGYSPQPTDAEMFIVGYRYAFLRRAYPALNGTAVERERITLAIWYAAFFVGVGIGMLGAVLAVFR